MSNIEKLGMIQNALEKLASWYGYDMDELDEYYETSFYADFSRIEKALKALGIIKEKGLSTNDIAFIKSGDNWETYAETMKELCWGDEHLDKVLKTQDEYDLLKEVLCED